MLKKNTKPDKKIRGWYFMKINAKILSKIIMDRKIQYCQVEFISGMRDRINIPKLINGNKDKYQ